MKTYIENTESKHITVLKKQEDKINHSISEITQNIGVHKKILDSNDVCLLSKYKSRNAEFRRFLSHCKVTKFFFSKNRHRTTISTVGSLPELSITRQERLCKFVSSDTNAPHSEILLQDELLNLEYSKKFFNGENYFEIAKVQCY